MFGRKQFIAIIVNLIKNLKFTKRMGNKLTSAFLTFTLFTNFVSPKITPAKAEEPPEPSISTVQEEVENIIDKKAGFIVEENSIKVIKPKFAKKKKAKAVKAKKVATANFETPKKAIQKRQTTAKNVSGKRQMYVEATAYSSTAAQCDSSPFVTASGTRVHSGTIAANFLPFGARIKIPDYFGDQVFVVEDRMAQRFSNRIDIWRPSYSEAIQFGKRNVRIVVLD